MINESYDPWEGMYDAYFHGDQYFKGDIMNKLEKYEYNKKTLKCQPEADYRDSLFTVV